MVGYIYLNTDLKTGKQYTGQHHYNKEGELDPNYHGSGVLWMRVLKKRPKELIKEEYIKTCYSQEELDESEKYYTKLFKTLYPNGYNLEEGGCGGVPCEETRRKMSESMKGRESTFKGKHHSEEAKCKMSKTKKGKNPPNKGKINTKTSIPILQYSLDGDLIGEFPSISEVSRQLNIPIGNMSHISRCCKGKHKSAYGFKWEYKKEVV